MPVLLFIRDHAVAIGSRPDQTIADVASEAASKMGVPAPSGWFGRELGRGRCLVMLDGLDEVADATLRKKAAEWVEGQMQAFGANRFLVTSRPFGYRSNPLSQVTVLEVRPFSSEQVERFIDNWYLANEAMSAQKNDEGVRIAAREGAADLLKRIRAKPALTELAVNPLLLTMIANVHRYRSSLPGRRVELYAEICEVSLGKRQQARGIEIDLTPAQKKRVLQPLAFHMMCAETRALPVEKAVQTIGGPLALVNAKMSGEEFLKMVENSSGLLLERQNGVYSFAHLSFQEYLAASHIVEEKLEEELAARVAIPWWHEVIRLYVALADATRIVEACIADREPGVAKLALAVECLEEALAVRQDLRSTVESIVIGGLEDPERWRARLAAEMKLALRLLRLTRIDDDQYADNDLISCAEYQLFVDDRRVTGDYRQPDHWSGTHFPAGSAGQPVLGMRAFDAEEFCGWLSARHGGEWVYQIPERDLGDQPSGGAGYWVKTPGGPQVCGTPAAPFQLTVAMLRGRYSADLDRIRAVPAHDVALARDLDRDLLSALNLARDLDRALARDLERNRNLTLALDRDLTRDLTRARDLARDLDGDLARDLARDLAVARSVARDLDRDLDRDLAPRLAHALGRDLAVDLDLARDLARARSLTHPVARDLARDLERGLDLNLDFARGLDRPRSLALNLDLARARALDFARDFAHARDITRARVLDRDRDLARARAFDLERNPARDHALDRAVSRIVLLEAASTLKNEPYRRVPWYARLLRRRQAPSQVHSTLMDDCLGLYIDLAILEERIEGHLPAFEGIRITKVRTPLLRQE